MNDVMIKDVRCKKKKKKIKVVAVQHLSLILIDSPTHLKYF